MTITCLPVPGVATSAQANRQAFAALMGGGTARRLGAVSGRPPGLGLEVSATSTTWTVQAGTCIIDAAFTTTQGPYMCASDATVTGSMTPADGSNPRIDIVYFRVSDTAIDSSGLTQGDILYLAGTPAASPTQPATPARSLLLGVITVPRSGTGSPSTAQSGLWTVAAGGILPVLNATYRDAQLTNPTDGQAVYRQDMDWMEIFNGSAWKIATQPSPTWYGTPGLGSYDTAKPIIITRGRVSGTTDGSGLFTAHPPAIPSALLSANAWPELGAATDCYTITRWPEAALTGGPSGTGQVVFQTRLFSTGAVAPSRAYLHSFEIAWQAA